MFLQMYTHVPLSFTIQLQLQFVKVLCRLFTSNSSLLVRFQTDNWNKLYKKNMQKRDRSKDEGKVRAFVH